MKTLVPFYSVSYFCLLPVKMNVIVQRSEIREIMKTWYKKRIEFPSNMEILTNSINSDRQNIEKALVTKKIYNSSFLYSWLW